MSRLTTWMRRELPGADARWLELRDGDELLHRVAFTRADDVDQIAGELEDAFAVSDTRSAMLVAIGRDGCDGPALTLQKREGSGSRHPRSSAGLLSSLMVENQRLRDKLIEVAEASNRALLAENARLAKVADEFETRRLRLYEAQERLMSEQAERDALARHEAASEERAGRALRMLREEWIPQLMDHLAGRNETKTTEAIAGLIREAVAAAPEELDALVRKLPPSAAATLEGVLRSAEQKKGPTK